MNKSSIRIRAGLRMSELILIYKWSILAAVVVSSALALIGTQLAARQQAMQTLVVSQSASLGVVLALGLLASWHGEHTHPHEPSLWPTLSGFLFALAMGLVSQKLIRTKWPSRNTYFIALFCLLMALNACVIAISPGLEAHTSAAYFGDLAVSSEVEAQLLSVLGILVGLGMLMAWRRLTGISFNLMSFELPPLRRRDRQLDWAMNLAGFILIAGAVQFLGLLFTLASLFLVPVILVRWHRSLRGLAVRILLATGVGAGVGFWISLSWGDGRLPTVPTMALTLPLSAWLIYLLGRLLSSSQRVVSRGVAP
ncbi:MAG TPA: metal ABC transporter permease [Pseudobdellovibrionaceae bacterium]|nr:metal ABC transporter permease [Pseudobdellovibrionaceae bacterium]